MQIIGLVGGVASGKSFVAREFAALGAGVLDADKAGHEALRRADVELAARARWGDAIFTGKQDSGKGSIERSRLAKIVFAPTAEGRSELKYLEQLTHPHIQELLQRQLAEFEAAGLKVAILDAPVMLKTGWNGFCHHIVFVDVPRDIRVSRARQRGWSDADFAAREAAQESIDEKRRAADMTVDNSGSAEATRSQVADLWRQVTNQ
jgi:dephospho-CoA kinase